MTTMLEAMRKYDSGDTYDTEVDTGVCWDYYGEPEDLLEEGDLCEMSGALVQKYTEMKLVRDCSYGKEFIADITAFARAHVDVLYIISQDHTLPMHSKDMTDEDNWYSAVSLVGAMQCGYACDDEYFLMVKELDPTLADKWCERHGAAWLKENEEAGYLEKMIQCSVNYIREHSCP